MTPPAPVGTPARTERAPNPRLDTPAGRPIDPASPWTDPRVGWRRLEPFASPLVGIAHRLFEQLRDVDDIRMTGVGAQACESTWLIGAACNELNGGGAGDPRQARAAAIGETVERYSGAYVDVDALRWATAADLAAAGVDHVRPDELTLLSAEQLADPACPFEPFTATTPLCWLTGYELADGHPVAVPAQLVNLVNGVFGDVAIGYSTSNGMACGCTWEEAVVSGLLELVERDAFTATWYGRLSLRRIEVASSPQLRRFFADHVDPTGLDVSLIDLSQLVDVPVVLAVVRNPGSGVAPLALGAAASASPLTAVRKAVIEAFQTRTWAKAEQREGTVIDPALGFDQVKDFDDHVRLSLHPRAIEAAAFLDASTEVVPLDALPAVPGDTPGAIVQEVTDRLRRQGVRAIACDVTSPDVAEGGLVVAKVFSPQLNPLDSGYATRLLGGHRLRHRAYDVGLLPAPLTSADLNPWPHPFP